MGSADTPSHHNQQKSAQQPLIHTPPSSSSSTNTSATKPYRVPTHLNLPEKKRQKLQHHRDSSKSMNNEGEDPRRAGSGANGNGNPEGGQDGSYGYQPPNNSSGYQNARSQSLGSGSYGVGNASGNGGDGWQPQANNSRARQASGEAYTSSPVDNSSGTSSMPYHLNHPQQSSSSSSSSSYNQNQQGGSQARNPNFRGPASAFPPPHEDLLPQSSSQQLYRQNLPSSSSALPSNRSNPSSTMPSPSSQSNRYVDQSSSQAQQFYPILSASFSDPSGLGQTPMQTPQDYESYMTTTPFQINTQSQSRSQTQQPQTRTSQSSYSSNMGIGAGIPMDFNSATSNPRPSSMQMEGGMQGGSGLGQGVVREGMDEGFENLEGGQASGSGGGLNTGGPDAETFEFMKRKKWPQLLMQELVGAAVWCLIPYDVTSDPSKAKVPAKTSRRSGWKVAFAAPATQELLGYRPEDLEGRDWADVISPLDLTRLVNTITNTITAKPFDPTLGSPPSSSSSRYQTSSSRTSTYGAFEYPAYESAGIGQFKGPAQSMSVFTRMVNSSGKEVLFELRGHAHFGDEDGQDTPGSPEDNGGFDGGGVMGVPSNRHGKSTIFSDALAQRRVSSSRSVGGVPSRGDDERPCKAFWIMGRKWTGQGDGGGKMLDTFLELKMENERLKQELKDLQNGGKLPVRAQASTSQLPLLKQSDSESDSDSDADTYEEDDDENMEEDEFVSPELNQQAVASHNSQSQLSGALAQTYGGNSSMQNYGQHGMPQKNNTSHDPDRQGSSKPKKPKLSKEEKKAKKEAALAAGGEVKEKKPKKIKPKPEYLCRNCGRNDSPEWRKGPLGPKTLCNACGLRWAKRNGIIPSKRGKKDRERDGMDDGDGDDMTMGGGDNGVDPYAATRALGI